MIIFVAIVYMIFGENRIQRDIFNYNLVQTIVPTEILHIKNYERQPIEKNIFRMCLGNYTETECGGRKYTQKPAETLASVMPDWKIHFLTDRDVDDILNKNFGPLHKITRAYNLINPVYGAARADLIRYVLIFLYGGVYVDMKSCIVKPLPPMPEDKDLWIATLQYNQNHIFKNGEVANWWIYGRKGSPILKDIIERIVENVFIHYEYPDMIDFENIAKFNNSKNCSKVLATTGPIAVTNAIYNSKNYESVIHDNSISECFQYMCDVPHKKGKKHYSNQNHPLVLFQKPSTIPKVIFMKKGPHSENIYLHASGYDVYVFDDQMCVDFISKFYQHNMYIAYNKLENDNDKEMLWAYCVLYIFGGHYISSQVELSDHVSKIFDYEKEKLWYSVIDQNGKLHTDLIATCRKNPVIKDLIDKSLNYSYGHVEERFEKDLKKKIRKNLSENFHTGVHKMKNDWDVVLLEKEKTPNLRIHKTDEKFSGPISDAPKDWDIKHMKRKDDELINEEGETVHKFYENFMPSSKYTKSRYIRNRRKRN